MIILFTSDLCYLHNYLYRQYLNFFWCKVRNCLLFYIFNLLTVQFLSFVTLFYIIRTFDSFILFSYPVLYLETDLVLYLEIEYKQEFVVLLIIFMLVLPSVYLKKQSTFHLCCTANGISYLDLCSSNLFSIPYYTFFFGSM